MTLVARCLLVFSCLAEAIARLFTFLAYFAAVVAAMEPMLQRVLGLQVRDSLLMHHQARGLEAFQKIFAVRRDLLAPSVGRWVGCIGGVGLTAVTSSESRLHDTWEGRQLHMISHPSFRACIPACASTSATLHVVAPPAPCCSAGCLTCWSIMCRSMVPARRRHPASRRRDGVTLCTHASSLLVSGAGSSVVCMVQYVFVEVCEVHPCLVACVQR